MGDAVEASNLFYLRLEIIYTYIRAWTLPQSGYC